MVPGRVFRRVSCALVLSFATTVASAESPTLTKIKSNGSVTLGYREASIPFSYLGTDQKPVGFSLDLCAQVVAKIKSDLKLDTLAVKLQPVDSTNRIPLIQNGTIDMECGATSSSVARLKQVAFTVAIFVSSARWLTKVSSGIHDVKDLDGKTVVATQGSNAVGFAFGIKAKGGTFNVIQAKDHGESMLTLQSGRAAAFMEDDILLASLKARTPDPAAFAFLPETYTLVPYGLMLPRDDVELKALADGVLKDMMASGAFTRLYAKWFESPIPPRNENLNFPMSDALKQRVAHPSDSVEF
ncbi:extracellular solute-binding protein family 3 [Methylobacterium sp. 4-46]|uniref:amino acid ABC transporter substrate-binding protein n=1 Tax=unclassified Methylobacterium TaxID=2615210 RepID=UPI000152D6C8|nr:MULTISPECIES: amino acid ABC transporter substrate-binding protein [Methylobacterium]ACA20419.1 extracellular solute-binding protein family 3 [Methylobacterium sp. 4-46]WFT79591.1 amino acid ABC transporter substrate-binding protein [Methylobacterium nodulans]